MRLRISARKSDLARLQAYQVGNALKAKNADLEIEYQFRESLGDKNLTEPLWKMPEKGVFTEDFVQDLLEEKTDLVVHSWKDLPTAPRTGTKIVATLPRADQRDLLLFKNSSAPRLKEKLPVRIFSSSPRRAYNLESFLKEGLPYQPSAVEFHNVRGNIQTRVRKLMENPNIDALVLAKAAMDRLLSAEEEEFSETRQFLREALKSLSWMVLPLSVNPNAAAQGALAIEIKDGRIELETLMQSIQCNDTFQCAQKERDVLASFGGGCHQKIGVAVLKRPYGEIQFLQGLTDDGVVLNKKTLTKDAQTGFQFKSSALASSREIPVRRRNLETFQRPDSWSNETPSLWISKAEALPEDFTGNALLWAAGTQTWRKLAARNLWVHGCAEGLGENESPQTDVLHGRPVRWTKLAHQGATVSTDKDILFTYQLEVLASEWKPGAREYFFWHSGSQFLAALKQNPELRNKKHACGPGNTFQVLKETLGSTDSIEIFLDEEEWRTACSR